MFMSSFMYKHTVYCVLGSLLQGLDHLHEAKFSEGKGVMLVRMIYNHQCIKYHSTVNIGAETSACIMGTGMVMDRMSSAHHSLTVIREEVVFSPGVFLSEHMGHNTNLSMALKSPISDTSKQSLLPESCIL